MKVKLFDVCDKASSNLAQKDLKNLSGDYPVYGASGFIKKINIFHRDLAYVAVVKDGAGVGRTMFLPPKSSIIGTLQYLLPKKNIEPKYLYYAVQHLHLEKYYTGATIPHIYFRDYGKELINLPKQSQQIEIVQRFECLGKAICTRKAQMLSLDAIIKSRFVEMFGNPIVNNKKWTEMQLTEVCNKILGGGTPPKKNDRYFKGNIPWVTSKDMKSLVITDSQDHITEEAINNSSTKLIPPQSVLMVIRSGILKHTLPVAINDVAVTINQDMKAFIPSKVITAQFLMYYFKTVESDILSGVRAVTADNINFQDFQKRKVIIPPIKLQNEFSFFVQQVDKLKFVYY